jgi:hypothetical protein
MCNCLGRCEKASRKSEKEEQEILDYQERRVYKNSYVKKVEFNN